MNVGQIQNYFPKIPGTIYGQKKLILVADDNTNDCYLLKACFENSTASVDLDFVHDGQEAIDYLKGKGRFADRQAHPIPALLLLDLKMPKSDGFEVLQWIRQQPGLKRLVVNILTSSNLPSDINRAFDLGANSYLVKPLGTVGLTALAQKLHDYWLQFSEAPDYGSDQRDR